MYVNPFWFGFVIGGITWVAGFIFVVWLATRRK